MEHSYKPLAQSYEVLDPKEFPFMTHSLPVSPSCIFQKLGIRDRTQAAIYALRQGLIPDEEM